MKTQVKLRQAAAFTLFLLASIYPSCGTKITDKFPKINAPAFKNNVKTKFNATKLNYKFQL